MFHLVREPLKAGMMLMGWMYRVDARAYDVPEPACRGCIRFRKQGLRERSCLFRWLNARVNDRFDRVLESIITPDELAEAKRYAVRCTRRA